jgi:hypothetical protein
MATQQIDGIYLSGYFDPDSRGVNVCGLTELAGFTYNTVEAPFDKFLEKVAIKTGWYKPQGNFLFAVTHQQITYAKSESFLHYLIYHPNTRVIHTYNNNAHAPNSLILICIHHMFPEQVNRLDLTNNVKDYL